MWQNCQSSHFSILRKPASASLPLYCHSSSYRYFKFHFKTLHSNDAWVRFLLPAVMSLLMLKMCSLYVWDAGAKTRSSATANKLEIGIMIFVTQPIFHGYRLHVRGGPWRGKTTKSDHHPNPTTNSTLTLKWWRYDTVVLPKADMTDIPQVHWQLGGNVGTADNRLATFEGFSGKRYSGGASSAIQWPKLFGTFFIPLFVYTFLFFPLHIFPFPFRLSRFLRFHFR